MFSILLLLQFCLVISNAWINRQSDGDLFDPACSACHGYNAQCTKLIFGSCCNECQCDEGYTVYRNSCRSDLSRSVLGMIFTSFVLRKTVVKIKFFLRIILTSTDRKRKYTGKSPNMPSLTETLFTFSKTTMKTAEQCVKSVQS